MAATPLFTRPQFSVLLVLSYKYGSASVRSFTIWLKYSSFEGRGSYTILSILAGSVTTGIGPYIS